MKSSLARQLNGDGTPRRPGLARPRTFCGQPPRTVDVLDQDVDVSAGPDEPAPRISPECAGRSLASDHCWEDRLVDFALLAAAFFGWVLSETSMVLRTKRARREADRQADRERVFAVLKAWQAILDSSQPLAMQKDHASHGRTVGAEQVVEWANDLNAAHARIRELLIEVEVLGPEWIRQKTVEVVGKLSDLNRDLGELDRPYTVEKGQAFQDKIGEMLKDRESLVDLARRNLTGSQ